MRVRLHRFARSRLCVIISYLRVPWVPFFHLIAVVYLQENRLIPFSATRLVKPVYAFKGHSFRIGAAPTAAAAGLPDWLIKVLVRWSSDCYQLYIHLYYAKRFLVCRTSHGARYLILVNTCLFHLWGLHASHVTVAVLT